LRVLIVGGSSICRQVRIAELLEPRFESMLLPSRNAATVSLLAVFCLWWSTRQAVVASDAQSGIDAATRTLEGVSRGIARPVPVRAIFEGLDGKMAALSSSDLRPLSLVSGDFNGDGFPDLVAGYGARSGGVVAVYFASAEAFAPRTAASLQGIANGQFPDPFSQKALAIHTDAAKDVGRANRRRQFLEDLIRSIPIYPITTELARKAGRIDAEQQEKGVCIAFQDLLIGVCALDLGYAVGTANLRHFRMIPGLNVVAL
jgi:predicted nucleic acid-binding protein